MQRQHLGARGRERHQETSGAVWADVDSRRCKRKHPSPSTSTQGAAASCLPAMDGVTERFRRLDFGGSIASRGRSEGGGLKHLQMFADRFIERRVADTPHPLGMGTPTLIATGKRNTSSCNKPAPPSSKSPHGQSWARVGVSQFRQQSLPVKLCQQRDIQQSVPTKFSPKQPLLDKRHSLRSSPVVRSSSKAHQRSRSLGPSCRRNLSDDFRLLTDVTREESEARVTVSLSRQRLGEDGTRKRLVSVAERLWAGGERVEPKKHYHSAVERSRSHEYCHTKGSRRKHLSAGATSSSYKGDRGGRGGGRWGKKRNEFLMGEAILLEESDEEADGDVFHEEGEDGAYVEEEEELTDMENEEGGGDDLSSEGEGSSIQDPFTCVQRTEVGHLVVHVPAGKTEELVIDEGLVCGNWDGGGGGGRGRGREDDEQVWRLKLPDRWKHGQDVAVSNSLADSNDTTAEEQRTLDSGRKDASSSLTHPCLPPPLPLSILPLPSSPTSAFPVEMQTHGQSTAYSASPSASSPSPALTPSLFSGVLPTIHFPLPYENYDPLPSRQRALLKWKMSPITPNVVKSCIARVGFSKCTKGPHWLGYWGRHMKSENFKVIREYQKVNHFPGTFQIGRKDRLWRNLSRMQARVGKKDCDFVPQTFVLPRDLRLLKREWDEGGTKQKWILKPPAAARGIGIRLASRWNQIPKKKPVIVQRYLSEPFLINGSKFDLRVYVYVSSYDPLRIYVFREGLTRFATCKYSSSMKNLPNKFMHLTNYSINKRNASFEPNSDETVCQGHKWGLVALWRYMHNELGIDTDPIWKSIRHLVIKTIICSESYVNPLVKTFVRNHGSCHELFGFDVMLDRRLKPWILEVNISPSLHSNSQLDVNIKGRMMRDILNMASFRLPTREQLYGEPTKTPSHSLSSAERTKHSRFVQRSLSESERSGVLDSLTSDDIRVLMETEDEHLVKVIAALARFSEKQKMQLLAQ